MRTVSNLNQFLNAVKAPVKVIKARALFPDLDESGIEVTSDDSLISWKLSQNSYFFNAVATQATLNLLGIDWGNLVGEKVKLYFSIKISDNQWIEVPCGSFSVVEQTANIEKENTSLKLYDSVSIAQTKTYSDVGSFSFPCTISDLAAQVSNKINLTPSLPSPLVNGSYIISEDLWSTINDISLRDIMCQLAGATACIIRANSYSDTLDFIETKTPNDILTLTYGEMKKWKKQNHYGQVNTLVLSRQPQEDNIVVQDDEMAEVDGNISVKLSNNEILDDDRELLALPILNSIKGMEFTAGEINTTGIGLFEVGDYVNVYDGNDTYKLLVTSIDLTIDGGVKEIIKCVTPDEQYTNYALSGSIYKTIWNTEIKVDKQGNQITSIVSRQDQTDETISSSFTQIYQNVENIISTVQAGGGGNLIKNSVGYGKNSQSILNFWDYGSGADYNTVTSQTSPTSINNGAISGNEIAITGASISQTINLTAGEEYTLSCIVDKQIVGSATISITSGSDVFSINYPDQEESHWENKYITFVPSENYITVTLASSANTTTYFTDLMLSSGGRTSWRQSNSEIYNTQVSMDTDGVKVSSSQYAGDYVEITPLEFAGYSNASGIQKKVFSLNRDVTEVEKLKARSQIFMPPIKITPINNSSYKGWAFVKEEND